MPYKHPNVFWDWDGTLSNTMPTYVKVFQETHRHFGLPHLTEEFFYGNTNVTTVKHFAKFVPEARVNEVVTHCYGLLHGHEDAIQLFPEARAWLEEVVARGGRNIVVSNKMQTQLLKSIKRFGLEKLFVAAVGGDELANHKPHPDHMYLAAQRAGVRVSPDDAMVGDSPSDYHIAKDTGTYAYLLHSQVHDFTELTKDYPKAVVVSRPLLHKTLFQG